MNVSNVLSHFIKNIHIRYHNIAILGMYEVRRVPGTWFSYPTLRIFNTFSTFRHISYF